MERNFVDIEGLRAKVTTGPETTQEKRERLERKLREIEDDIKTKVGSLGTVPEPSGLGKEIEALRAEIKAAKITAQERDDSNKNKTVPKKPSSSALKP